VRSLDVAHENPIDRRAVLLAMGIVPVSSYLVVSGTLPFPGLLLAVVLCPIVAVLASDKASPVFVGATAGALALILSFVVSLGLAWILWSDLSSTFLADLTYLSFIFGFPAAVGGVIGAAAIGGVLGKLTQGTRALLRGDVHIELEF
jgi:hypothetical protein